MFYAKVLSNNVVLFPYTWEILLLENPYTAFDDRFGLIEWYQQTEEAIATGNRIVEVDAPDMPTTDIETKNYRPAPLPVFLDGRWHASWVAEDKTPAEIIAYQQSQVV